MAEAIGLAASIYALAELIVKVVKHIDGVANAPDEIRSLREELDHVSHILLQLRDLADRVSTHKIPFPAFDALEGPDGPFDQFKKILETLASRVSPESRRHDRMRRLITWPLRKSETDDLLKSLERYKTLFLLALNNDQLRLMEALREDFAQYQRQVLDGIAQIVVAQEDFNKRVSAQNKQDVIEWLGPLDFFSTQNTIFARHVPGTGRWFLESREFTDWVGGKNQVLWCPGNPGAGKTYIAATVINHLRENYRDDSSTAVFSIYCRFSDRLDQSIQNLLASVCAQSMHLQPLLSEFAMKEYHSNQPHKTPAKPPFICELLRLELKCYSKVFIVVDAVDECTDANHEQRTLLEYLHDLTTSLDQTQILFTSRYTADVKSHFPSLVTLPISARSDDLEHYIRSRLPSLHNCVRNDTALQDEIVQAIVQYASGMFILAYLQFETLKDKLTSWQVRATIRDMPKAGDTLAKAYDRTIERIDAQLEGHRELANLGLCMVVHALRPMRVRDLRHALAIIQHSTIDEVALCDPEHLTMFCAGLVVIDQDDTARLTHYTTQSYFESIRESRFPQAHRLMAKTCLQYLWCVGSHKSQSRLCDDGEDYPRCVGQWHDYNTNDEDIDGFSVYLMRHGFLHLKKITDPLQDLVDVMLALDSKLGLADLLFDDAMINKFYGGREQFAQVLQVASSYGFEAVMRSLITHGVDVNYQCRYTALHYAVINKQSSAVQLLLENGADISPVGPKGRTPLHECIHLIGSSCCLPIMRLLLEHGASVSQDSKHSESGMHLFLDLVGKHNYADNAFENRDPMLISKEEAESRLVVIGNELLDQTKLIFKHPTANYDKHGDSLLRLIEEISSNMWFWARLHEPEEWKEEIFELVASQIQQRRDAAEINVQKFKVDRTMFI